MGPLNITLEVPPNNTTRIPYGGGWSKTSSLAYYINIDVPLRTNTDNLASTYSGGASEALGAQYPGYSADEWPGCGAFDKRGASSGSKQGWHTNTLFNYNDVGQNIYDYLFLPFYCRLSYYTIQLRQDNCCTQQAPSAWTLYTGSTVLHNVSGERNWALNSTRTYYPSDTSTLFNSFSLNLRAANQSGSTSPIHIGELRLYVIPDNTSTVAGYTTSVNSLIRYARRQLGLANTSGFNFGSFRGRGGVGNTGAVSLVSTVLANYHNT